MSQQNVTAAARCKQPEVWRQLLCLPVAIGRKVNNRLV